MDAARLGMAGLVAIGGLAAAGPANAPALSAVARIEPGEWEIKATGASAAARSLCIADAAVLIQYGHAAGRCRHFVVTNETDIATVEYSCRGIGHGSTTFKVATPRAFNLETQGILGGAPFEEQYEARRVGPCTPGTGNAR